MKPLCCLLLAMTPVLAQVKVTQNPGRISVDIDGKPATLVLDTGAPDITLDSDFSKALGLTIAGDSEGTFLGGRTARVRHAVVHSIDVGPISLKNVTASILPSHGFRLF